ncbi:MAG: DUF2868 domain-containing protein, partial [Planctomycetota bacterium]
DPTVSWILAVEDWQVPSKKCLRHLRQLRASGGTERLLLVALLGGSAPDWRPAATQRLRLWRRHLTRLQDPRLLVEDLIHD